MKQTTGGYVLGETLKGLSPGVTQPGQRNTSLRGFKPPRATEAGFLRQVQDLAKIFGWTAYHPALSKWSERGFPDLTLVRPPRVVLAELKTDIGKTTHDQDRWLGLLRSCPGVETYLWRPADFDAIAEILR